MKKFISIILMFVIIAVISGCGNGNNNNAENGELEIAGRFPVNEEGFVLLPTPTGTLPSDEMNELGFRFEYYRFSATEDGDPVIIITYSLLNGRDVAVNNSEPPNFYNLRVAAQQLSNIRYGVPINLATHTGALYVGEPVEFENFEISPGGMRENIEKAFVIDNWLRDIELLISATPMRFGREDSHLVTIPLGGLVALEPVSAEGLEPNIVNGRVEINGVRTAQDNYGNDVAIVSFSFANFFDFRGSPLALYMHVEQGGVRLQPVNEIDMPRIERTAAMRNYLRFIDSGYMLKEVERVFLLNDLETDLVITTDWMLHLVAPLHDMVAPDPLSVTLSLP